MTGNLFRLFFHSQFLLLSLFTLLDFLSLTSLILTQLASSINSNPVTQSNPGSQWTLVTFLQLLFCSHDFELSICKITIKVLNGNLSRPSLPLSSLSVSFTFTLLVFLSFTSLVLTQLLWDIDLNPVTQSNPASHFLTTVILFSWLWTSYLQNKH